MFVLSTMLEIIENLAYKLNLTVKQFFLLIGFTIILVSVPLSFALVRNAQVFNSQASGIKKQSANQTNSSRTATQPHEVPSTSPLSDQDKQVKESTDSSSLSNPTSSEPSLNTAFGPTLNIKVSLEGRPQNDQSAKVFVGIAAGTTSTKPTYILSFTVDFPTSGIFSGLSLAGLNPGSTYTAYIKGPAQIDSSSVFAMSPTETSLNNNQPLLLTSGDLNEDNTINSADYAMAKNLYGATSSSPNWNSLADFNHDGIINNIDLSYIINNLGKTGASGIWYSPAPASSSSATPATGGAQLSPSVGGVGGYGFPSGTSNQRGYWFWMPAP